MIKSDFTDLLVRGGSADSRELTSLRKKLNNQGPVGINWEMSAWQSLRQENESLIDTFYRITESSPIRHKRVMLATSGLLRAQGFVIKSGYSVGRGVRHCNILVPTTATDEDLQKYIDCFDIPVLNPFRKEGS